MSGVIELNRSHLKTFASVDDVLNAPSIMDAVSVLTISMSDFQKAHSVTFVDGEKMRVLKQRSSRVISELEITHVSQNADGSLGLGGHYKTSDPEPVDEALQASVEESIAAVFGPLSDDEITEMLGATLHGPLPTATMSRVFTTLALVPGLRQLALKAGIDEIIASHLPELLQSVRNYRTDDLLKLAEIGLASLRAIATPGDDELFEEVVRHAVSIEVADHINDLVSSAAQAEGVRSKLNDALRTADQINRLRTRALLAMQEGDVERAKALLIAAPNTLVEDLKPDHRYRVAIYILGREGEPVMTRIIRGYSEGFTVEPEYDGGPWMGSPQKQIGTTVAITFSEDEFNG